MSRLHKLGSIPALFAMLLSISLYAIPTNAWGQDPSDPATEDARREVQPDYEKELSTFQCYQRGQAFGNENASAGGNFAGGLVGGLFLGLLGTLVAYVAAGDPQVTSTTIAMAEEIGCDESTWIDGFKDGGRSKKKNQALIGGLLGTAVLVAIVLAAGSGS